MTTEIEQDPSVGRPGRGRVIAIVLVLGLLILLASLRGLLTLYTDYLWFDDLDRTGVWSGILTSQIILSVVFVAIFFVLAWVNLVIADRIAPALRPPGPEEELLVRWHETVGSRNGLIRFVIAGFFALVAGAGAAAEWNEWILFNNPVEFGTVDPVFGRDLSFYVFRLPFLTFVVNWFFAAFIIIGIITGIWHYINGGIRIQTVDRRSTPQVKAHISVILAILALLKAADYYLQRFELLTSTQGTRRGAFFTDLNASLPAIQLLLLISLFSVVLLVANIWRRGWAWPSVAVGLWALIAVLAGGVYPAVIQQFQVSPDELTRERDFLERNIAATRVGLGLDNVIDGDFTFDDDLLTREEVLRNPGALANPNLLDPRIIDDSFTRNQQDLPIYDDFAGKVDIDRYEVDGEITPVVVGAREIANDPNVSWQVRHANRTHGYGFVLAPANQFSSNGEPQFLIGDAPLENQLEDTVLIDQPQIYFGEGVDHYAVTGTTEVESDFIEGFAYDGEGGVPMNSLFSRVAFAFRFSAIEPLISGIITDETEVLFARDVTERARRIAPFLQYDSNPYPIVLNGGISYVIDGYTTSDQLPYSEFADVGSIGSQEDLFRNFNYIRNSVKVVVDGFDGTVDFYVVDTEDPLLAAYRQAFPEIFRDASEMPDELSAHLRYPEDLFKIQTTMWGRYQLDNVTEFFTGDLSWAIASNPGDSEPSGGVIAINDPVTGIPSLSASPVDPYYQVTQLPDEDEVTFVVSRTFVPQNLPELNAYFIGRVDENGVPELRQYQLSAGENVSARGPVQIDELLNSDPEISEERTELGRGGSEFLSGNLVPLLVEDSVVYVRPFYVRRERAAETPNTVTEPQVQFVTVVQEQRLGFGPTYESALSELFNISREEAVSLVGNVSVEIDEEADQDQRPSGSINLEGLPDEVVTRLGDIFEQFEDAEDALPDFAEFDRLQDEALEDLEDLLSEAEALRAADDAEEVVDEDPDSA